MLILNKLTNVEYALKKYARQLVLCTNGLQEYQVIVENRKTIAYCEHRLWILFITFRQNV